MDSHTPFNNVPQTFSSKTKAFFIKYMGAGNEILPRPSQPVGAPSVPLAEIIHFSVGHAPPGPLRCFLESGYVSGASTNMSAHLSAAVVPLFPSRCPSPTAAEL